MNPNTANEQLNILDRVLQWTEKYSFWKILKGIAILWFIVFSLQITFNPASVYEKYIRYAELVHQKKIDKRLQISPLLQCEIERVLLRTNATRCTLLECHNSNSNSAGVPFYYADVSYEAVRNVPFIGDYYKDFNIGRYKLLSYVYQNKIFSGSIEDLKDIDERLAIEMPLNNSKYITILALPNNCGFLVVTYDDESKVDKEKDLRNINFCFNKIVKLFNE